MTIETFHHDASWTHHCWKGETHKWLGCMFSALGSGTVDAHITYHLQAAARAFHSNTWICLDKTVSLNSKLKVFEATLRGFHLQCVGQAHGMKSYMYGTFECNKWPTHTPQILHWNRRATLRTFTQPWDEGSFRTPTACEKDGQETKDMGHKD